MVDQELRIHFATMLLERGYAPEQLDDAIDKIVAAVKKAS